MQCSLNTIQPMVDGYVMIVCFILLNDKLKKFHERITTSKCSPFRGIVLNLCRANITTPTRKSNKININKKKNNEMRIIAGSL